MKMSARVVSMFVLLALPAIAWAEGMTLDQIAKMRFVSSAVVSPDGAHIAYTRVVPRVLPADKDGAAWTELHVIDADGQSRPFITGSVNVSSIGWTPDGQHITFLNKRGDDATRRLYALPIGGGEARAIAALETDISAYSFSPDGARVALLAFEPVPADLKREREMGFSQVVYEEDWTPRRLYTVNLEEGALAKGAKDDFLDIEGSVQQALWSPGGDRLAVVVTPRELVDDTLMFKRIRIVSPEGAELGRIDNPGKLGQIAWSPDGEHLAFIATESLHDTREGRLMVAGKNGGAWAHLLPGLQGHVWHVDWKDANNLLFISYEGLEARIATIRPDGSNQTNLVDLGGPIWDSLSVSDRGDIVLTANAPTHPREVFRLRNNTPERLTDSNPWIADVTLARQEAVTYSARDGLDIEGVLFYPLDYQPGRRHPLILVVHGGPEAHYSNGWLTQYNAPADHAAAEGYFVFYPNYRGSTGRGVEFTETSQGRPAMEEFDDLIDGVDFLIEQGMVDADRVGITGGSYGGYASAWGATYYSERFAAAVMNVGISDTISKVGTSDIPQELYLVHYLTWPWEDWEMFYRASPIRYITRARTPILILHGDADPRVDPTQSKILHRYLVLQENPPPVRLVLYRGEGHGNRRAASRYDYSLRLMQWMNHYLKGEGGEPPDHRLDYGLEDAKKE
ncbi:MAG: S9 family peptidase [Phycisphaerales bacterium]|nr:MAG: S9 family peptidase [Phycisphaerales bacterium]